MKGTISRCLLEMIDEKMGSEMSNQVVAKANVSSPNLLRMSLSDVPEDDFMKLFTATLSETGLSMEAACDAFGEFWCCTYVPKNYNFVIEKFSNAKEMILGMDKVHTQLTATIKNARPPHFEYHWQSENELEVTYISDRGLIDVYVGLARGVGKYFKEDVKAVKMSESKVLITFS